MTENDRLRFVEKRSGKEAMLKFAEQGLYAYIQASVDFGRYKENIDHHREIWVV